LLIRVACSGSVNVFAGLFVHYAVFEEYVGVVEDAGEALFPGGGAVGLEECYYGAEEGKGRWPT
jgi:hypothetical protein